MTWGNSGPQDQKEASLCCLPCEEQTLKKQTSIIVVGGGFAGTTVAKRLAGRLPADVALTLVSEESYTTFNPMLPEAVGASIFPEQVVAGNCHPRWVRRP